MFSALHLFSSYNHYINPGEEISYEGGVTKSLAPIYIPQPPSFHYAQPILPLPQHELNAALRCIGSQRRPRSEKKPIPEDQKDEKYYEKRKRNNQAAKKSRDARRFREDQIALRASMLEQENAVLRAQVITLRDEAQSLRELLLHKRKSEALDL